VLVCKAATADRDSRRSSSTAANGSTQPPFDWDVESSWLQGSKALPLRAWDTAVRLGVSPGLSMSKLGSPDRKGRPVAPLIAVGLLSDLLTVLEDSDIQHRSADIQ
jgi:hypothetical protein